jgi:hypothetical protein
MLLDLVSDRSVFDAESDESICHETPYTDLLSVIQSADESLGPAL